MEKLCNAPLKQTLIKEISSNQGFKRLQMQKLAKALLFNKDKIPRGKLSKLTKKLKGYFPDQELNDEFLKTLTEDSLKKDLQNFPEHGKLVVNYFEENGGLEVLVEMCRQRFMDSMKPKFMPEIESQQEATEWKFENREIDENLEDSD
jgi:hypothetical protein